MSVCVSPKTFFLDLQTKVTFDGGNIIVYVHLHTYVIYTQYIMCMCVYVFIYMCLYVYVYLYLCVCVIKYFLIFLDLQTKITLLEVVVRR